MSLRLHVCPVRPSVCNQDISRNDDQKLWWNRIQEGAKKFLNRLKKNYFFKYFLRNVKPHIFRQFQCLEYGTSHVLML